MPKWKFKTQETHELSASEDDLVAENLPKFNGYEAEVGLQKLRV